MSNNQSILYPQDVEFELITSPDTFVGETVVVQLKIKNNSDEMRMVEGRLSISSMYYTGIHYKDIKDIPVHGEAKPKSGIRVVSRQIEYLDCRIYGLLEAFSGKLIFGNSSPLA